MQRVNFYRPVAEASNAPGPGLFVSLLLLLLLLAIVPAAMQWLQREQLQTAVSDLQLEHETLTARHEALMETALPTSSKGLLAEISALDESRRYWQAVLELMEQQGGQSVAELSANLRRLDIADTSSVWLESFVLPGAVGDKGELQGRALSPAAAATYIQRLEKAMLGTGLAIGAVTVNGFEGNSIVFRVKLMRELKKQ